MGGFGLVFGVDCVGEVNRLVNVEACQQILIKCDEVGLPRWISHARDSLRLAVLKA